MDNTLVPEVLQMIGQVIPEGVSIAISDGKQYTYYKPSEAIDLKIEPGDLVPVGSATHKALEIKGKVAHHVESRVFGIPYYGVSIPVIMQGRIEGYITAIYSPQMMPMAIPEPPRPPFLIGRDENGWLPIPMNEIMYISSNEGKTQLHTANGAYTNKYNMAELESLLAPGQFIRCHRSYFVNLEAIRFIHPHFHSTFILEMKDKQKSRVPVSQSYASSFRQLLGF
ncbi:LytTR family DNA-binding domain-containing protein [Brevibacillus invocatus]|uniref:LytTR family DNA-binding domain-containing protein n=1 Tax=Brevibacillus invocatus TaxID=173959 RepID=UPI00203F18F5|nr:LytTR family DNA-binding domain-containing protein [Brevibacillus invocatus]MCM3079360.1 LytTR family transcriptional regulator [Brevibacillus invocatus]MCM3429456.1 LytTR family transcriptional regulator [Brevibacillus invocatus]